MTSGGAVLASDDRRSEKSTERLMGCPYVLIAG
jgi:hypothetical protein